MLVETTGLSLGALVGAVLGSFATTAALRTSQGLSALAGRSRCDLCHTTLGFAHTVPVVSYVTRCGRCGACGAAISPIHLLGELAGAVTAAASVLLLPTMLWPWAVLLNAALIYVATFDALTLRIPNAANLCIAVGGLALATTEGRLVEGLVVAGITGSILLLARASSLRRSGKPGLGLGDVKLLAALSTWTGAELTPVAVVVSSVIALGWLALRDELTNSRRMPFAPAIALGFSATFLFGRGL